MEILGNNSLHKDNSYLNLISINPLQARIDAAQTDVTLWNDKYEEARKNENLCENLKWYQSCKERTGKTESTWRSYRKSRAIRLTEAKAVLANAQKAYNDAVAANKAESTAGKLESEMDTETAKEWGEKGKTFGLWGVAILVLAFGGLYTYKRFIK